MVAVALFPAQAGVAQQLPSVPSLPPAPNLPPTPNLPPAPPVEVPSTPSLPAPDVQVPDVQAPQLPVSPPSTPNLPSTGSATDALPSAGSPSGQSSGSGSSAGGQAGVPGQTPAGGGTGSAAGRNGGSEARRGASVAPPRSAAPAAPRARRAAAVRVPAGLPSAQRRVVVMRSGFGPGGPRARPDVARMLNTGRTASGTSRAAGDRSPWHGRSRRRMLNCAPGSFQSLRAACSAYWVSAKAWVTRGPTRTARAARPRTRRHGSPVRATRPADRTSSDGPTVQLPLGLPAASPADLGRAGRRRAAAVLRGGCGRELFSSRRTAQYR